MEEERNDNLENMEEEEISTIILTDEDGNEVEFDFLGSVEYEDSHYVVMMPSDGEEDGEVVIMQLEEGETEDEDSLLTVTDERVMDAVYAIFKEENKDFYDFYEDE